MTGYNPNTYDWYQCDEETYDSNASPEEQAESAAASKAWARETIAAMRETVATVPAYCERYVSCCHLCGEKNKTLLVPCQGCKKLVCPRCSLHPAVVLTVCDTCVEVVGSAIASSITAVIDRDGGAEDANLG